MKKMKFNSMDTYAAWFDGIANPITIEKTPCAVVDGWKISLDLFTECKSWKTALNRFAKTFAEDYDGLTEWAEGMRDGAEHGTFFQGENENPESGSFSWGIEKNGENRWYIFLNVSGVYK